MRTFMSSLQQTTRRLAVLGACALSILVATAGPALAGGSDWGG
jgi:hypothetical protein